MLFLYFADLQKYLQDIAPDGVSRAEDCKRLVVHAAQLKCLLRYLEEDYLEVKKALKSLLDVGHITFDLLWSLFRPNEIIYTSTYNATDEPRAFRVT